jgi:oligosaccharide repeat unit polymerase
MLIVFFVYLFILITIGYLCISKGSLINVYSMIVLSLCVVYILPYLNPDCPFGNDQYFAIVISIGLIGFFASFFLVSFLKNHQIQGRKCLSELFPRKICRTKVISVLAVAGVILTWFGILQEVYSIATEGIVAYLLRDRISEYQEVALGYGHFVNYLKSFLTIPIYLEMFRLWRQHRRLGWFYFGTLLLEIIFLSHTRFVILSLLALPFLYYHFYVRPIAIKKLVILMCFLIVLTGVFNVIRGGQVGQSSTTNTTSVDSKTVFLYEQLTKAGSGSTETFYQVFQGIQKNQIDIEYGKQYLMLLYTPIPRSIWPEKPIVSYFWRLTEIVEGQLPGIGQKVLTSTILGEAYHQFGLVGVFLTPLIYMLMIYFYVLFLGRYENTELIIWITLIHIPMDMRGGLASIIGSLAQSVTIFFILSVFTYKSSYRGNRYNPVKSIFPF